MDRVKLIERSLAAFGWGIVGFFPIIGIMPAVVALSYWVTIELKHKEEWNPASGYLYTGAVLSVLGLGGSFLIAGAVAITGFN